MGQHKSIGNRKRKDSEIKSKEHGYECPIFPVPKLTLKDMTKFKNQLYKAITTDEIFMVYNGRRYSQEYAKFVVKVIEKKGW